MHLVGERLAGSAGSIMFVLMPLFALGLRAVYLNRRLRYTEHLVFALHLHAFWFAVFIGLLIPWPPLSVACAITMLVYQWLAMRRVYRGRWWALLIRIVALDLVYSVLITTVGTAAALVAVLL